MPVLHLTQAMITQGIPLPEGVGRFEACCADLPGLYLELRATSPGQGTYYYRYKDHSKKTCHKRIGSTADITLADARKQAKQIKAEIALGAYPKSVEKEVTVPTFTDFFEQQYMPYVTPRKRSWASDESLYRNYLKDEFTQRLDQITRQQIQRWHTKLRIEKKLAPATADHGIKLLKHALNLAMDWSLVDKNPAAKVPLFNVDNKVERYLDDVEMQRLLHVLSTDENRPVCLIALFLLSTGARLNEALTARWDQVNRQTRVWRISAAVSKSGRVRAIPLNDSALEVLSQLDTEGEFDHLFVNRKTGKPYTTIMKVWSRLRAKAGLASLRCHDLRHIYASALANDNVSIFTIAACLGHQSVDVTKRYAHLSTKSLQDAANSASIMIQRGMPIVGANDAAAAVPGDALAA